MSTPPDASKDELTSTILQVAIEVHRKLGRHQPESVYHRGLAMALRDQGLEVDTEYEFEIRLDGTAIGSGAVDLLVEGEVALELKAVKSMTEDHFRQLGRNVTGSGASRGLLLNFGEATLGIRRYVATPAE